MAGYDRSLYQMYLTRVPMFAKCSESQLDRLAELGEVETVADGQTVVREGDIGDRFYVLSGGNVRVQRDGTDVTKLGEGAYFGELALFDDAPRNATIIADGTAAFITLSRDAFTKALDEVPAVRDALLRGMAHRLNDLDATG
jgi:CRP-like cAMP-binding protein